MSRSSLVDLVDGLLSGIYNGTRRHFNMQLSNFFDGRRERLRTTQGLVKAG